MLIIFLLGFSSGLPLLLTSNTIKLWLAEAKVDITIIGYFGWVGMAYTLKFMWAPILDRFAFLRMGRRRFWMVASQTAILIGLMLLGTLNPNQSLALMAAVCVWIAFFSATQDIAIDALRTEYLSDEELGMGSSMSSYGSRVGLLVSGGFAVGIAGYFSWMHVYWIMALLMSIGIITALLLKEPNPAVSQTGSIVESVVAPFKEFMKRKGAVSILLFVFFYKFGDAMSGAMLSPFYKAMGYENVDIALIAKTFGTASALIGLFIGGVTIYRIGIGKALWIFGFLQALSTAGFALITYTGPQKWALAFAVLFEDITAGMGSAAFLAFIATVTNRKYTATQFAILSSIAVLGRNFFSGFSGHIVKALGWEWFFYSCALMAIPGMILLYFILKKLNSQLT